MKCYYYFILHTIVVIMVQKSDNLFSFKKYFIKKPKYTFVMFQSILEIFMSNINVDLSTLSSSDITRIRHYQLLNKY